VSCRSCAADDPTPNATVTRTLPGKSATTTTPRLTLSNGAGLKEIDKPCPYISNSDWAQGEGNRAGRSVQLNSDPVGCPFYFENNPSESHGQATQSRMTTVLK